MSRGLVFFLLFTLSLITFLNAQEDDLLNLLGSFVGEDAGKPRGNRGHNDGEIDERESEDSVLFTKEEKKEFRSIRYKCLGLNPDSKADSKKFAKLTNSEKVELFRKGPCAPVVLVPGYMGSKLEFVMKDCKLFKQFHSDIMNTCGWKTCTHKLLKKFTVFVNFEFDMSLLFGGNDKKKYTPYLPKIYKRVKLGDNAPIEMPYRKDCLGNFLRLYFKKSNQQSKKYDIVQLMGAEVRPLQENPEICGRSTVTNFLGEYMTTSRQFQGFHELIKLFTHLGYTNGLNLLIVPYDFRRSVNEISPLVEKAILSSYEINKKKSILIGHSYGGLHIYKASLGKHSSLIERNIAIGSPFLGSVKAFYPYLTNISDFNQKKKLNIFGMEVEVITELDKGSAEQMMASFVNTYNFFVRDIKNDGIDEILQEISRIENLVENFGKELQNKQGVSLVEKKKEYVSEYQKLLNNSKFKEELEYLYSILPKTTDKCESIMTSKVKLWDDFCKVHFENLFKFSSVLIDDLPFNYSKISDIKSLLLQHSYIKFGSILNNKVHESFKVGDDILDFYFENAEKELFEFPQPKVPFMFIHSQHIDSDKQYHYDTKKKKIVKTVFGRGDGTVNKISQIYPFLRWLFENKKTSNNNPLHLVEYCSLHDNHSRSTYKKDKTQYLTIGCDCIKNKNLIPQEECNHSSMINDNKLKFFIKDVVVDNHSIVKVPGYEDLYQREFKAYHLCQHLN